MPFSCWLFWLLRFPVFSQRPNPPHWYFHQKCFCQGNQITKLLSWPEGIISQMRIWKNWQKTLNNRLQKARNNISNLVTVASVKRENSGLDQITIQPYQKFEIPTTYHCTHIKPLFYYWKMIVLMNQYWWRNIKKATKSACLACPT